MNCSQAEQLFDAFLDGELSAALRLEFDAHRLRCETCRKKLALLEACESVIASDSRQPALADDFTDRVMAEIAARRVSQRLRRRLTILVGSLALQAAAVGLFVLLWPASPAPTPTPPAPPAGVSSELDLALRDPTGGELIEYIHNNLQRSVRNTRRNVAGLLDYLGDLSLLSGGAADDPPGLLRSVLESLAAPTPPADRQEPTPSAPGRVPL